MKKIDVVKKIEVKDGKKKKEPTVTVKLTQKEALTVELILEKAIRGQLRMIEKPDFKTRMKIKKGTTSIKKLEEGVRHTPPRREQDNHGASLRHLKHSEQRQDPRQEMRN